MRPDEAGLDGLADLFQSLLHEPDGRRFGCLITNTAIEPGADGTQSGVSDGLAVQGVPVLVRGGYDLSGVEEMITADGVVVQTGASAATHTSDGRLRTINGFVDAAPA